MDYLKYSGISAIVMRMISIIMHILIIVRVLPYQWVSGGMILEYQPAAAMAMISICILLVSALFYATVSGFILVSINRRFRKVFLVLLLLSILFDLLGVVVQFMGTDFERHYTSIVASFTLLADCSVCLAYYIKR